MNAEKLEALFQSDDVFAEYLNFKRIPKAERRNSRPDICAMVYLSEKFKGTADMIPDASYGFVFLGITPNQMKKLTREDVVYLVRCGVGYFEDSLCFLV